METLRNVEEHEHIRSSLRELCRRLESEGIEHGHGVSTKASETVSRRTCVSVVCAAAGAMPIAARAIVNTAV